MRGRGYFTGQEPDALLTEVRRQALDSPVLWLATRIRESRHLPQGQHGDSRVIPFDEMTSADALLADVVLTGHNRTRRAFNLRLRELQGFTADYPQKGEPLIALTNRHELGIYNGTTLRADSDSETCLSKRGDVELTITVSGEDLLVPLYVKSGVAAFEQHRDHDLRDDRPWFVRRELVDLDWAYCLTVHKSQGSQWSSVMVADDRFNWTRPTDRRRWLYTALTRAIDRVTVATP